ncbi:hypothetical protein IV203_037701 [Nitzschia inconspicua]|uniref:Uncharacterized protein n=1 Tax=Nitzschia inconspicua TaxID=303405 RepID=A0A9K3Q179_9STRA|nr:hypothetical protein IV203_037701 [Nitzschia inconspicua]
MTIRSDNSGEDAEEAVMSGTQTPHSEEQCATTTTTTPQENAVGAGASMPTTNDDVDTEDDVDVTHALMVEGKGFFRADEEKESAQQVKEKEFSQTHQCRSYSDVVKSKSFPQRSCQHF